MIKVKMTEEQAVIVKHALQRHGFEAGWYRKNEADVCHAVATKIGRKLDTHQGG
ncbi:hypothetical protein PBI_BOGOSYJAY_72 [Mycobacterium phage BogosyJay]|nr:hypothetical protein PBI_MAMINIAINA_72 [Mycobacterium phage Maminiaina]QFG14979.1 hypothetical protein PBI_BOGOSYJAY_72 [Mycobacterium phage BogosyJay]